MAGEARTDAFVLSSATLMLGPMASLYDLTPATHSIGLVKNFTISSSPTYQNLTQGVKGQIVYSVMTANEVTARCEVYEYTAQNLKWALGLEGTGIAAPTATATLKAALTGTTSPGVTTATFDKPAAEVASWPSGSWVMFQDLSPNQDHVHVAKLSAATTSTGSGPYTHTLTFANHGFKTGNNMPIGAKISVLNTVDIGLKDDQPFFAAKIVGILPEDSQPFTILMPKVRILRGFNVAFSSENFGNMPFELQPYEQVSTDPFYGADFPGMAKMLVTT